MRALDELDRLNGLQVGGGADFAAEHTVERVRAAVDLLKPNRMPGGKSEIRYGTSEKTRAQLPSIGMTGKLKMAPPKNMWWQGHHMMRWQG